MQAYGGKNSKLQQKLLKTCDFWS